MIRNGQIERRGVALRAGRRGSGAGGGGSRWGRLAPWLAVLWVACAPAGAAASADGPWHRYESPEFGFSIEYPAQWRLPDPVPQGVAFEALDGEGARNGNCSVSVDRMEATDVVVPALVLGQMSGEMVLASFRKALPDAHLIGSGQVRMGDRSAFYAEIEATPGYEDAAHPYRLFSAFTYDRNRKYTLLCAAAAPQYADLRPTFLRIRESFRIGPQPTRPTGPDLNAYVSGIGRRLAGVSERPDIGFVVVGGSVPNLLVLNGPRIGVTPGLLARLDNEAELAAVLAHEIAHLAAGHGYGPYTEAQEEEADRIGMQYLADNNYDVSAEVTVMERFAALASKGDPGWNRGLLTYHPPSEARLAAARVLARKAAGHGVLGAEMYHKVLAETNLAAIP
jgi:hypothetical protein